MSQNLQIDPTKKDYVFVNGSPVASDRIFESAYIALMIPQNKYIYGEADQGSLLYTLEGQKRTSSIEQQFSSYAKAAINKQLIDKGIASKVDVVNLEATKTGTSNQIQVTPSTKQIAGEINFIGV